MRRPRSSVSEPAGITIPGLLTRAGTAAGYAAIVLIALWFGVWPTAVLFGLLAGLAVSEFLSLHTNHNRLPNERFAIAVTSALPVAAAAWGAHGILWLVTILVVTSLAMHVLLERARTADTAAAVFAAVYVGLLLSFVVLLRGYDQGRLLSIALVVSVWASDVAAYLVGSLIGRHKMAPRISPKKSWEGFAAGLIACVGIWAVVPSLPGETISLSWAIFTGTGVGIAAVIGDLAESRVKREAGVKDSGTSLPGHGGFLDRLDSLIVASLVAYWILWWGGVR